MKEGQYCTSLKTKLGHQNKITTYPSLTLTTKSSGIYLSLVTSANGVFMLKLQNLGGFSISYLNFGQNVYSGC